MCACILTSGGKTRRQGEGETRSRYRRRSRRILSLSPCLLFSLSAFRSTPRPRVSKGRFRSGTACAPFPQCDPHTEGCDDHRGVFLAQEGQAQPGSHCSPSAALHSVEGEKQEWNFK